MGVRFGLVWLAQTMKITYNGYRGIVIVPTIMAIPGKQVEMDG